MSEPIPSKPNPLLALSTGLLLIVILYFGKPVLMPLALAALLAFLLNPMVNFLCHWRLPRGLAVLLVTMCVFSLLGVLGWVIGRESASLAASLPNYQENITQRINSFYDSKRGGLLEKLQDLKRDIEKTTDAASAEADSKEGQPRPPEGATSAPEVVSPTLAEPIPPVEVPQSSGLLGGLLGSAGEGLGYAATVVLFLIFILLRQQELRNRLMRLGGFRHVTAITRALDETGNKVGRYLMMQALINGLYGGVLAVGLYFLGMPYVVLWGVLAALFRFIPYVGPIAVAVLPSVLSLAVFNDWQHPLMVVTLIAVLELLTNMVLEPVLYGQTVGVSDLALLVAIVFWTWLWGGIGLVMATPLTVCLVVMAKHVPTLEWVETLMGDNPKVLSYMVFFQRLLADDEAEAEEYILSELKKKPAREVVDEMVLPTIALAKRELRRSRMSEEEEQRLHESVFRIMDVALPEASSAATPGAGPLMLGRPLEGGADEAALHCFDRLCPPGLDFEIFPVQRMAGEFHAEIEARQPSAILLSATPPGSHSNARLQVRRLRTQFPKLKIYVGRWGVPPDVANAGPLMEAGASGVFTQLAEAESAITAILREASAVEAAPPSA